MADSIPIPRKLTPEVHTKIVQASLAGNYHDVAARYAGIGRTTFFRWMKEGEAAEESGIDCPQRDLWNAVKEAESQAEIRDIALIELAAKTSWQAAAWRLERMYPHRWGRHERIEHSGEITSRSVLSPEQVREELAAFGMAAAEQVAAGPDAVEAPADV